MSQPPIEPRRVAYSVLGELAVEVDGVRRTVRQRREGLILSLLIAARGAVVSAERLVDDIWDEEGLPSAPERALASLQVGVSRLRAVIEPDRAPRAAASRLVSAAGGYALRAAADDIDAWAFEAAAESCLASSGPASRVELAATALALWAGEPYLLGSEVETLRLEADRLRELRLAVVEAQADGWLALGQHERVVRGLAELASSHPFREQLWATLALAQYRAGRQAEALATIRTLRQRLDEDLGVDPSGPVRALEQSILSQDPILELLPPQATTPLEPPPRERSSPTVRGRSSRSATGPTASGVRRRNPPLVGRTEPVAAIDQLLAELVRGVGGSLVISGEPGIGKSRLVEELLARAGSAGVAVAVGHCHDADVAPPFWPWLPVLRALVVTPGSSSVPATPDRRLAAFSSVDIRPGIPPSSALRAIQPDAAGPSMNFRAQPLVATSPAPATPPPEVARLLGQVDAPVANETGAALRTFEAVSRLLRDAARSRPLLVVLEDLHWADASSLGLLNFAVAALATDAVQFVVTRRPAATTTTDPLGPTMAGLARHQARRISLVGLAGEEVRDLLRGRVGDHDPSLAAVLSRRTGGNPFFLIEMARLLAASGTTDPAAVAALPVPEGIRDVIRLRLARLPAGARTVLDHACVQGGAIDVDLVAQTARLDVAEVLDQLDVCAAAGLVGAADSYSFAHVLTRESIYGDLPAGRRTRMHADLAAALQSRVEDDPDLLTEVAHHAVQAAVLGTGHRDRALAAVRAAARQAELRLALPEALDWWRRAQQLAGQRGVDPVLAYEVNRDTGRTEFRLGLIEAARASMDAAVRTARGLQRWDLVPEAATSFAVAGSWSWRDFGPLDEPMVDTLTACLDHLPEGAMKALVLACLQMEHYFASDAERGEEFGRQSIELARASGDAAVLVQVLLVRGLAGWARLTPDERIALAEECLLLPMNEETRILGLWQLGGALHQAGRPAESDAVMARCLELAASLRHTGSDIPLAWWRFMRAVEQDDPAAAALGAAAEELHRRAGYVGRGELAAVYAVRGRPVGAPVPAETVDLVAGSANSGVRALVAFALLEAGEPRRAVELLGPPPPPGELNYATLATHCLRVAVYAAVGDADVVRTAAAPLDASQVVTVTFGSIDSLGALDYFRALAAYALGDRPRALGLARSAVDVNSRIGNRPWGRRAARLLERVDDLTA